MKRVITAILPLFFPVLLNAQMHGITHDVEFDLGYVKYHPVYVDTVKLQGPGLTVRYAMGITKYLDLLASASMSRGTDHRMIQDGLYVMRQYNTESVEIGVRGHVQFLKRCYVQLSAQTGIMMSHLTDCYDLGVFTTGYRSNLSYNGSAGIGIRVTPVVAISAYFKRHGHVGVIIHDNPQYDFSYNEWGLSLSCRIQ